MIIKYAKKKILNLYFPIINKLDLIYKYLVETSLILEKIQESLGRIELRQSLGVKDNSLNDYEFKTYSQWGEDGIIQYLVNCIEIKNKIFVEFGVENYTECNTKFLLVNNNWSGLVIDGDAKNIQEIRNSSVYWKYNLKAVHSFITKENINDIFLQNGLSGEIGLLSIDIDGNDYWVWESISVIDPVLVVIEYNYRFGKDKAVTIPYYPDFIRSYFHHSMIYFGASIKALVALGEKKGYDFIGCSSNGVNAFFVRKDKKPSGIKSLSVDEGYIKGNFCEYRDPMGQHQKISPDEEIQLLHNLQLPIIVLEDEVNESNL